MTERVEPSGPAHLGKLGGVKAEGGAQQHVKVQDAGEDRGNFFAAGNQQPVHDGHEAHQDDAGEVQGANESAARRHVTLAGDHRNRTDDHDGAGQHVGAHEQGVAIQNVVEADDVAPEDGAYYSEQVHGQESFDDSRVKVTVEGVVEGGEDHAQLARDVENQKDRFVRMTASRSVDGDGLVVN